MNPALGVIVSAALALGPAPVRLPDRFEDIEAQVQDLAAQKRYELLAATAERAYERRDLAPFQRRLMAFFAIRGLHGVFEDSGQVTSLCHAQRLLRRVEREVGLDEDASTAARLRAATAKHLARSGAADPCPKPVTKPRAVVLGSAPAASRAATPSDAPADTTRPATEPVNTVEDGLLAVRGRDVPAREPDASDLSPATGTSAALATAPTGPAPAAPVQVHGERRQAPNLNTGGVALLSIGAAAGAVFGASLFFRGRANDTIAALKMGDPTQDEYARAERLNESYQRLTVVAGVTGAVAIAGVVSGVVLFAVQPRRTTTAAAPWAGPTGAGLTIRGHF